MAKNAKLPKRIAGVKLSKKVRRNGGQIYALMNNPIVADLVAVGLLAAADALVRSKHAKKAGKATGRAVADTAGSAAHAVGTGAAGTAEFLAFAARELASAIRRR